MPTPWTIRAIAPEELRPFAVFSSGPAYTFAPTGVRDIVCGWYGGA